MQTEARAAAAQPRSPSDEHHWRGYLLIAAATLCWGAAANFGKAVFNGAFFSGGPSISPVFLTQARTTFTVLLLVPFLYLRSGRPGFRMAKADLLMCFLVGTLGVASSNYFYYLSVQKTTIAVAITLQYTAPVWVLLYMVLRGRQPLSARSLWGVVLSMVGCALTIGFVQSLLTHGASTVSFVNIGTLAALVASFSFAFYNIAGQRLVTSYPPITVMFYVLLGSAILWTVVDPPWKVAAAHYSGKQWFFVFLFACFSMFLPYILHFNGLKYLDPTRAIITSCLEPVFAVLFAVWLLHEPMSITQAAGVATVLIATVLVQITPRRPQMQSG